MPDKVSDHNAELNDTLLHLTEAQAMCYVRLRVRAQRLIRLRELSAPQSIIDKECELIVQALDMIDPEWRNYR
jgi:hypothetical protein